MVSLLYVYTYVYEFIFIYRVYIRSVVNDRMDLYKIIE